MELTPADIDSPLWRNLKKHLEEKLESCRASNDNSTLSETETARLRGRIAELKTLIDLGRPAAKAPGQM